MKTELFFFFGGEEKGWESSLGGGEVIYCGYLANIHFIFFHTNSTPILFGAAKCPAETPCSPAPFAPRGGHLTQLWPWRNQSEFLVKFSKGSHLKSHVSVLLLLLSPSQHWQLELQQRFCDHEVTWRMKASARNGKTERERSLDIDDLVEPTLSGLPVSGLPLHDGEDILLSKLLFAFWRSGLFLVAEYDSYMVRLDVGVCVCVLESGTQNKWIKGVWSSGCSKVSCITGRASQVVLIVKNLPANAGDIRDAGSIPGLGRSPGEGHGNPLQYSCLETPMDRGAWWPVSHGVTLNWTWLSD